MYMESGMGESKSKSHLKAATLELKWTCQLKLKAQKDVFQVQEDSSGQPTLERSKDLPSKAMCHN